MKKIFLHLYTIKEYFNEVSYDSDPLKNYMIDIDGDKKLKFNQVLYDINYQIEVYGLSKKLPKTK